MYKTQKGFTLVELLIVIVVIAILASLSVVAYNGVQERAERSAVQSDIRNLTNKVELFKVANDVYPASISDCPNPGATSLCLSTSDGLTLDYKRNDTGGGGYITIPKPSYELAVLSDNQFLYTGAGEKTGGNEFMQYVDLAPYIDKYGLKEYQLSFDIKSVNTANSNRVSVYFQNGSNTRYGGLSQPVTVTTDYVRHTLKFTANMSNPSVAQAMLAFYGSYGTGNRPIVKNVQFQLAP